MVLLRGEVELELHEDEDFSNHIRRTNDFYEPDVLDYIRDNFNQQGTILDIGANIGNHTTYFATYLQYFTIHAFEPIQENVVLLEKNIAPIILKPRMWNPIELWAMAVSNHDGTVRITPNKNNMGASEISPEGEREVRSVTVDKFFKRNIVPMESSKITLMKIDVEWHELQVIEGALDTISRDRPLVLIEDTKLQYSPILEGLNYRLHKDWPHHQTYLWKWAGE